MLGIIFVFVFMIYNPVKPIIQMASVHDEDTRSGNEKVIYHDSNCSVAFLGLRKGAHSQNLPVPLSLPPTALCP